MSVMGSEQFSPVSTTFLRDPHSMFAQMRKNAPSYISEWDGKKQLSLFKHSACRSAFTKWETFSSVIPEMRELFLGEAEIVIQEDPPNHTVHKKFLAELFSPQNISKIVVQFTEALESLLLQHRGVEIDFLEDIAAQVALVVTSNIVGIPTSELKYIREWTNRLASAAGAEFMGADVETINAQKKAVASLHEEFTSYLKLLIPSIREPPRDSLLFFVRKVNSSIEEAVAYSKLLLFASNHTSAIQLTNTAYLIASQADQFSLLKKKPKLLSRTVDEVLRYKPVFRVMNRRLAKRQLVNGMQLDAGSDVLLWIASANRDEDVFQDANSFDITRTNASAHLSFGLGPHYCLGAGMAKQEVLVLLRSLILTDAVNSVHLTEAPEPQLDPWVDSFRSLRLRIS